LVAISSPADFEGTITSAETEVIGKAILTGELTIASSGELGTPRIGDVLTANYEGGNSVGVKTYSWIRYDADGDFATIATGTTHTLVLADRDNKISVVLMDADKDGALESDQTAVVLRKTNTTIPSAPTTTLVKHNRITLAYVAGYEYSDDGGETWHTPVGTDDMDFGRLTPATEYTFIQRVKQTNDTEHSANSAGLTVSTLSADDLDPIQGAVAISPSTQPRIGDVLTASVTGGEIEAQPYFYFWITKDAQGSEADVEREDPTHNTYTVSVSDFGKQIAVEVESDERKGKLASAFTLAVLKKANATAPLAPTVETNLSASVTLHEVPGYEYSIDDGETWQHSNVFSGLQPATAYSFVQRVRETEDTEASTNSTALPVTTRKNDAPAAPAMPVATEITAASVTLEATEGYEYSRNGSGGGAWQDSPVFEGLAASANYTFYQRIKETSATLASESSPGLALTTKGKGGTPAAPVINANLTTHNSITLVVVVSNALYSYSSDGGETWSDWQTSNVFTDLEPETAYIFRQKRPATSTLEESDPSPSSAPETTKEDPDGPDVDPVFAQQIYAGNHIAQTSSGLSLTAKSHATVEIFSISGKLAIRQTYAPGAYIIPLGNLPKGMYVAKVNFGSEKQTIRVAR
jgi:hypothetical protein